MVITVEPGLYIAADAADAPAELRGIGVRIEDDIAITADGNEVLTAACPKEIEDARSRVPGVAFVWRSAASRGILRLMCGRMLVAVGLLAGCFAPRPAAGVACSPDGDCPDGLFCVSGACERSASADGAAGDAAIDDATIDAAMNPPALVQQITASLDHSATLSATLPAKPVAGNVLVMIGANEHDVLSSVTGGGATWTIAAGSAQNANIELWFGITDGSSATVTINCVTTCDAQPTWMNLSEWSGLASSRLFDVAIANDGLDNPARTNGVTTTGAHDLLVVGVGDLQPNNFGEPMPGTWQPFTPIVTAAIAQSAWYAVVPPGTYTPTVSETGNNWDALLVGLHAR